MNAPRMLTTTCSLILMLIVLWNITQQKQMKHWHLRSKSRKQKRSIYKIKNIYRCHHDTRYEGNRDTKTVLEQNPFKRFRNTNCSFHLTFKVLKVVTNGFTCNILLEHRHNNPINSLEALSFKMLSEEVREEVTSLFLNNLTP